MKLALLGFPIQHSLSPKLYREMLGSKLNSYELLEFGHSSQIPSLVNLAKRFNGINITTPYKKHFFDQVIVESSIAKELSAINTISFTEHGCFGTNTDALAVESILSDFKNNFGEISLILLGSGVMAKLTQLVARNLSISLKQYSRAQGHDLEQLDLSNQPLQSQLIIINACTRDFVFKGKLPAASIFWDYNYNSLPHQNSLPCQVQCYLDGLELLRRQAQAAIDFWKQTNFKLKC